MGLTFDDCIDLYLSEKEKGKDVFFKTYEITCPDYSFLLRAKKPCLSSIDFVSRGLKNNYLLIECDILAIYPYPQNVIVSDPSDDTFTIYPHTNMALNIEQVTLSELPLYINGYLSEEGKELLTKGI